MNQKNKDLSDLSINLCKGFPEDDLPKVNPVPVPLTPMSVINKLPKSALLVYLYLCKFVKRSKRIFFAWPSISRISLDLKLSKRVVCYGIARLEKVELVVGRFIHFPFKRGVQFKVYFLKEYIGKNIDKYIKRIMDGFHKEVEKSKLKK